jgi:hypothetical protein
MLALLAADRYMFGHVPPIAPTTIQTVDPTALGATLRGTHLAQSALKFITVMAFVDGVLDQAKIAKVLDYATALGISERYLDEIKDAASGHLQEALADMVRCNITSITGHPWLGSDPNRWLLPYADAVDPALTARFETLGNLPRDSFGWAFWSHFKANGYAFPGDPSALNAAFSVPHDSVHVLTGYHTDASGELLSSTFTAAMHPDLPMAGHVLPVLFSWHLKVQINPVAREASGALDPSEFWRAWASGAAATVDTFAPGWDLWRYAALKLAALRQRWSIPPQGLND